MALRAGDWSAWRSGFGQGLGALIREAGRQPQIVVGHDFRSYSISIKQALTVGLMSAGIEVRRYRPCALSPVAYFAQFALDIPASRW
ncbi:MAG: hypothetical protein R3C40_07590 [Parvularculaceae bacterium]